ncbi:hypothetical protein GCM10009678_84590 [Actinomadura kijaniata]
MFSNLPSWAKPTFASPMSTANPTPHRTDPHAHPGAPARANRLANTKQATTNDTNPMSDSPSCHAP